MSEDDDQDNINSTNKDEDQPERSANDPSERGESGSVPAPEGVWPCNTPCETDNVEDNPLILNKSGIPKGRVLRSGIDSLNLSVNCEWIKYNDNKQLYTFIDGLKDMKKRVKANEGGVEGLVREKYGPRDQGWGYTIQAKGQGAYNLVINGKENDFSMQIFEGENAGKRPRVIIELRSKYLHEVGEEQAIKKAISVLRDTGAKIKIEGILVSRMDLYCDYLDIGENINSETRKSITSKAGGKRHLTEDEDETETIYVGPKGADIQLRIYDKKAELKDKGKTGSLDHEWNLREGEEEYKIWRIEYQLKREALRSLGIDKPKDIQKGKNKLWGYLTKEWSRDLEKNDSHKDRQEIKKYWKEIQHAFILDDNEPPITKKEKFKVTVTNPWATAKDVYKALSKLLAECIETATRLPEELSINTAIEALGKFATFTPDMNDEDFKERVMQDLKNLRNRKAKEKIKILNKSKKIINLSDGSQDQNLGSDDKELLDIVKKKIAK